MPTRHEQSLDVLVSLAASTLDEVPALDAWQAYALGRPPERATERAASRLPLDAAAVSLHLRRHREELFRRICGIGEGAYCGLGRLEGRAHKELVEGIAELIEGVDDAVPPRLLAAILVRLGLEQYCTCRGLYRCGGVTRPGLPCRRQVWTPGELCWQHASQSDWFRGARA